VAAITGAQYLSRTLDACGIGAVFLVPTAITNTLFTMEQETSIKRIVTHGEKASAYMADGYARATGLPGVCAAQNIGGANLAAGLRDAYLANSPVIALTGGPYEWSRGRHYYQEIEDFPLFKPVTKFSGQVHDVARFPDMLHTALRVATSGKPGPTHLELAGHTGDILEAQSLEAEIRKVSYSTPTSRCSPDPEALRAALARIASAQRPVIVAGGGVRWSGAAAALRAFAEKSGIPVATSMNAKDTFPGDHPLSVGIPGLYARKSANQVILAADLVIYVGSQTGSQVTLTWQVPSLTTPVVQIDISPEEIGHQYADTVGVVSDAKLALEAMTAQWSESAERYAQWSGWAAQVAAAWRESLAAHLDLARDPMRPELLVTELSRVLPDNAIVVSDTGHAGMWTAAHLDLVGSNQGYLRAAGSLGWGLPAGIGAQIGRPDAPVVVFTGDGGAYYHLSELETAARWNIPVTIVVNDNRSLNQEINPYLPAYGGTLHGKHAELWHFDDVNMAAVAESFGVKGIRVTKASEFESAMHQAQETPGPVLIDVVTDIDAVAPKGTTERSDIALPRGLGGGR
jgi:acetolactate synthase-1/2/3 large subunit